MSNEHTRRHPALACARCLAALLCSLPLCLALWGCEESGHTLPEEELDQSEQLVDLPVELPEQELDEPELDEPELDEPELPCTEGAVRIDPNANCECTAYETCLDGAWVALPCECPQPPRPAICDQDLFDRVQNLPVQFGLSTIALPKGFVMTQIPEGSGAIFQDLEAGLFGFVAATPSPSCCLPPDDNSRFASVALGPNGLANDEDDNVAAVGLAQDFHPPLDWDKRGEFPFEVAIPSTRFELLFEYGEQSANPNATSRDAAGLRNAIFQAISGTAVSTEGSAPCPRLRVWWLEQWRNDPWTVQHPEGQPLLLSTVLVACEQPALSAQAQRLIEEVFSGTHTAPGNYSMDQQYAGYFCETVEPELSAETLRVPLQFYPIAATLSVASGTRLLEWSREWHYDPLHNELVIDLSGLNDAERKDLAYSGLQWGELSAG